MKRKFTLFALIVFSIMIIAIMTTVFVACGEIEPMMITITFDSNGGSEVASITIEVGAPITLPANPTKSGYIFSGWYIDSALIEGFDEDAAQVIENITLYAKWNIDQNACEHNYSDWAIVQEPTCIVEGLKAKVCTICGLVQEEAITALGHDFAKEWTVDQEPTCIEDGGKSHHCSRCEEVADVTVIDALGHKYIDHEAQGQTSSSAGFAAYQTCANCDWSTHREYSVGLVYTLSDDNTYYIVSDVGACDDANITIPHEVDAIPVKEIGKEAFFECSFLVNITIPDGVTSIGDNAFWGCSSMTSITIPDSVTSIGNGIFSYCSSLTSITIPNGAGIPNLHPFEDNGVL